jgi:hypothetical protein
MRIDPRAGDLLLHAVDLREEVGRKSANSLGRKDTYGHRLALLRATARRRPAADTQNRSRSRYLAEHFRTHKPMAIRISSSLRYDAAPLWRSGRRALSACAEHDAQAVAAPSSRHGIAVGSTAFPSSSRESTPRHWAVGFSIVISYGRRPLGPDHRAGGPRWSACTGRRAAGRRGARSRGCPRARRGTSTRRARVPGPAGAAGVHRVRSRRRPRARRASPP